MTDQWPAAHPVTDSPPGGDPADPGHVDQHLWQQPHPGLGAGEQHTLTMTYGEGLAHRGSSLASCHPREVTVTSYRPSEAAARGQAGQFGQRAPSAVPGQPAPATAPINSGVPVAPRPSAVPYAQPPGGAA